MKKKIEINTMIARNVYSTESFEFVKKILEKFCKITVPEKAKEIHKQNKPFDYTDEYRIYGTDDQGIKYHSYYKASEKEMRTPTLYTLSSETFGCKDFWVKFTISTQDGLLFEYDIKDKKKAQKVVDAFEKEYGYCRKQSDDEIFDELIHEMRTRGSENNGKYGIKKGLDAIKIYPDDFWARFYLGCSYLTNKQYKKAIKELKRAIKIDSKSYDAYYNLGRSYLQNDQLDKAKETLLKALTLAGKSHAISYYLGMVFEKLGNTKEATKYYQLAIENAPENITQPPPTIQSFLVDAKKRLKEIKK